MTTNRWQRLEGLLIFVVSMILAAFVQNGWPIWVWPLALLAPDLSMLGYVAGPRVGAFIYNLGHLYCFGIILAVVGVVIGYPNLIPIGMIWTAHVGIDRALGYGLKHPTGFRDTHLGRIGRD
ncbi:DUF4260 domain-containing protein [Paracoccus fistulariae]|uniref:DUF4260 domain-containing protein n=1 Tax=Paracoccus fistulariae TaxID=658446 RepID=A0ABY7SN04_9RHOB|nr:DUF4260 domain-containing protein [Paracoccus fistulariae]MDB6180303.1 DUF4260 domain-containing protein [Paracoccus fistulariae]WCR08385.1 DUF4260 domain-containing protein [Paracoccus fistulariae]